MKPYRVDVSDILEVNGGQVEVADAVELDPLVVGDETFTFTGPVSFDMTLTNTSAGIVGAGNVNARVSAECSRCLEPFEMPLEGEIEAFYVQGGDREGIPDEQQVEPIEDSSVDVMPAIVAALVLEAPFAPLCSEECKGICPQCGANRNVDECGCEAPKEPSPFDVLKDMFPGQEE